MKCDSIEAYSVRAPQIIFSKDFFRVRELSFYLKKESEAVSETLRIFVIQKIVDV